MVTARCNCRWRFSGPFSSASMHYVRCVDLLVTIIPVSGNPVLSIGNQGITLHNATGTVLESILRSSFSFRTSARSEETALKLVLVPRSGFLSRHDLLTMRMRNSKHVDLVIPFSAPGECFPFFHILDQTTLLDLLSSSIGALLVKQSSKPTCKALEQLGDDVLARMHFDWIRPTKLAARRAALVGGRPAWDMTKDNYGAAGPFEAARGLGLSVIVLDRPGHWLEDDAYSHLREDFIAIDVSDEDELPRMIAEAVQHRDVDCVLTFSDEFVIATAKAAEILGLPTEPVTAILQAHYKEETRGLITNPDIQVKYLENASRVDEPSILQELENFRFPLVVKPCRGGGSRGVKRANDFSTLRDAVRQMQKDGLADHGVLLETYVDGPEVDANIIIWDGDLLFFEISDDFPCQADATDATLADNFAETLMVSPSALSPTEMSLLGSTLHDSLLRLGFRSGVFHVEARIRNSSMCYREVDDILDLETVHKENKSEADIFLIEVNARPPGLACAFATLYTYGVDLCALHFLRALGDKDGFVSMSKPFSFPAQFWCSNCQIPIHKDDILVPHDFLERVYKQLPGVVSQVARAELLVVPGTRASRRADTGFVAYFLLYSRTSRRETLLMSVRVQEAARNILDNISNI